MLPIILDSRKFLYFMPLSKITLLTCIWTLIPLKEIIKERIINSQEISKYSSSTVRKLIAERKDIIFDRENMDSSITKMYENAIDYIFSMVVNEEDDMSYALESTDVIDLDYLLQVN